MKPWETEPIVWKEFCDYFYHGCLITEKGKREYHQDKYHTHYLIFRAGYKSGFLAGDNGDGDGYYELTRQENLCKS